MNLLHQDSFNNSTASPTKTNTYTYGDSVWKDKLTSYNGNAITYDASGNPTNYKGVALSWEGRKLASYGSNISFDYDENGIRTRKTVGTTVTDYYYNGSLLMGMTQGSNVFLFSYDASGNVVSVNYNGTEYYYLRNAQSDIVGIIDGSGNIVVKYTYDAWGKLLSMTQPTVPMLAGYNPFRYRGYVYDVETGRYYVTSRYYDPSTCRFINADDIALLGANGDFASYNLFMYCGNNPIARADKSGGFWHLVIGDVIGGIIGGVSSAVSGGDLTDILIGAVAGAAGGVLAASGAGVVVQALGSAAISMASNAAQQINGIVNDEKGEKQFKFGDMIFDGIIGLACGIRGGNGASFGNTAGINSAWKQLFKRGVFDKGAWDYFMKTAHKAGGVFVLDALGNALKVSAKGTTIITIKNIIVEALT